MNKLTAAIWAALAEVPDPEIPVISVVDLGIIYDVALVGDHLRVEVLPTFVGCPALDLICSTIGDRLQGFANTVEVAITFAEPWTTDRISEEGRQKLELNGFAPPAVRASEFDGHVQHARCPFCRSQNTVVENSFGPTLCRAIHHCNDCNQPFEQFKSV
jgi:ring-1,2-phenylacetyl-CoA epoxidase subunit PaaD